MVIIAILWLCMAVVSSYFQASPSFFWWTGVVVCLLYQLWWVWPYLQRYRVEIPNSGIENTAPSLSLLTSNVLMDNRNTTALLRLIREKNPDIVATLETNNWWQKNLDSLDQYPHRLACALENKYGMHLYSKIPLENAAVEFLVEYNIPSMNVEFLLNDSKVRLHVVHPTPPAPNENVQSTERDVELLILAKHLENIENPIIVTGDLNDVAWSKTTRLFRKVSGLLDPRVGRGMFNTFHVNFPFIRWPLDHVFLSHHWRIKKIERLGDIGSDHFPVFVDLTLDGSADFDNAMIKDRSDKELEYETLNTDIAEKANKPTNHRT